MLTSDMAIAHYDFATGQVQPDRLHRRTHEHYVALVDSMLEIYRNGAERRRQSLHRDVEDIVAEVDDCPPRRVAAFCKLLDDHAEFHTDRARSAKRLRAKVFSIAAPMHPIVQHTDAIFGRTLTDAQNAVSEAIGMPWPVIEAGLFSDVVELQVMKSFPAAITSADLLAAYNVAQVQATLYRATAMVVETRGDVKTILRHAKLAGLMHRIHRQPNGIYRFLFDGPASKLRNTWRYGIRMARMLPKLLSCSQWRMAANILGPGMRTFRLQVTHADGLRSTLQAADPFDSELERDLFQEWSDAGIQGWTLERESEVLEDGQEVFTPDFRLVRVRDGKRILIEVIGFWTTRYLQAKLDTLEQFAQHPILCLVTPQVAQQLPSTKHPLLVLDSTFQIEHVIEQATRMLDAT
jgi:uncharacterized protein